MIAEVLGRQVINLPDSSSGGHKLKINALAVLPFNAMEGFAFSIYVWKQDDEEPPPNYDRRRLTFAQTSGGP